MKTCSRNKKNIATTGNTKCRKLVAAIVLMLCLIGCGTVVSAAEPDKAHAAAPVEFNVTIDHAAYTVHYRVKGGGFDSAATVQFPTWTTYQSQDDIVWYTGTKQSDGSWTADVPLDNHFAGNVLMNDAVYVHIYAWDSSGNAKCLKTSAFYMTHMSFVDYPTTITRTNSSSVDFKTVARGQYRGATTRITFPTWSVNNGQDDIVWVDGTKNGYTFSAHVSTPESGQYITHMYAGGTYRNSSFLNMMKVFSFD